MSAQERTEGTERAKSLFSLLPPVQFWASAIPLSFVSFVTFCKMLPGESPGLDAAIPKGLLKNRLSAQERTEGTERAKSLFFSVASCSSSLCVSAAGLEQHVVSTEENEGDKEGP